MNPKAMGAALAVVAVVVIACVVLLGGDEGGDSIDLGPDRSPGATVGPTASPRVTQGDPGTSGSPGGGGISIDPPVGIGSPNGRGGTNGGRPTGGRPTGTQPGSTGGGSQGGPGQAQLRLLCSDSQGNPLPGVNISARRASGAPLPAVVTDAEGKVALAWLPEGEQVEGEARHPLYRDTVSFGPRPASDAIELSFVTSPVGTLRGRIVDSNGEGVRDAELVLVDPKQNGESILDPLAMGLGPDGSFFAEVAAGQYAVSARGPGKSPSDQSYLTVPEGGEADAGNLVVLGKGSLAGNVQLPGDLTAAFPVEVDLVVEIVTGSESNPVTRVLHHPLAIDASMTWELPECDPGRIRMRLELPQAGDNRVGGWVSDVLEPGKRIEGLTLTLQEVMAAIQGVVRDDQGIPLEGAEVICGSRRVSTDRDGTYVLRGLDLGSVFVEVHLEGHGVGFKQVTYQGAVEQADFNLPRTGSVRGRVTDAEGNPAADVPVQVVERMEDGGVRPHETRTDASGYYEVPGLVPGVYYLKAGPGDPFDDAGAPSVDVHAGEAYDAGELQLR